MYKNIQFWTPSIFQKNEQIFNQLVNLLFELNNTNNIKKLFINLQKEKLNKYIPKELCVNCIPFKIDKNLTFKQFQQKINIPCNEKVEKDKLYIFIQDTFNEYINQMNENINTNIKNDETIIEKPIVKKKIIKKLNII